jgi:hypothetical protein
MKEWRFTVRSYKDLRVNIAAMASCLFISHTHSTHRCTMGAVFRPRDLAKGRKRVIESILKDIHPDAVEEVIALLSSWEGAASEEKLKERIGHEKTKALLDLIKKKSVKA